MNRLSLIRWPGGSGGSGSGGTTVQADNGTSVLAGFVVLGQAVNQASSPGKLLNPREIPFNGQSLLFSGIGASAGNHLTFKRAIAGGQADPYMDFLSNTGSLVGEVRFTDNGTIGIGPNAALGATGQNNIAIGTNAFNGITTGLRNIAIGSGAMQGNPTTNPWWCIVLGTDSLDNGGQPVGNQNIIIGHNAHDSAAGPIGTQNISIGNFINNSTGFNMGDGNILIGKGPNTGNISNTTAIGLDVGANIITLSNVNIFGDSTKNTILGFVSTSQADSGDRLQVLGTIKVTNLPITPNPKVPVAWDTVTNRLVNASGATLVFTADNGLNINAPNNVELGGTLIKTTLIHAGLFQLNLDGNISGGASTFNVANTGATGSAIIATNNSSSTSAILADNSGSGPGLTSLSFGGGTAFVGQTFDSSTNSILPTLQLRRLTSGTAADGIGTSIEFYNATTSTSRFSNSITSQFATANDATRTSTLTVNGVNSGATTTLITFFGDGHATMTNPIASGNLLFVNNTEPSANNVAVRGQSINGSGGAFVSSTNDAVFGQSTSGSGGNFQSTNGIGLQGVSFSATQAAFVASLIPTTTNTVRTVATFQRQSTGSGANGIGSAIELLSKTNTSTLAGNLIQSVLTDVTAATPSSQFAIRGLNASTSYSTLLTIDGTGIFTITQGLGNFVNDAAAAIGGVPVNGLYRNGSVVQIRVT